MNKRAIFFTLLSIIFINIFLLGAQVQVDYKYVDVLSAIESRVSTMDDFIDSLEEDAARVLYISGFRAIVTLDNYVINPERGGYLASVDASFLEAMTNASVDNNASMAPHMQNQTLDVWRYRVENLSRDLNLSLELNFSDITISQSSPWMIHLEMDLEYTLEDDLGVASYNRTAEIDAYVPIEGRVDPLRARETGVQKAIYAVNDTVEGVQEFKAHVGNMTYINSTDAPSFLMRLEGEMGASEYGIETIYNPVAAGNEDNLSCVGYHFWNATDLNTSRIHGITDGDYPLIWLDDGHLELYNLTHKAYD